MTGRVLRDEPLPEHRSPTHVLRIEVPLHLDKDGQIYFDPVRDAIQTVLALSRLASSGALCGQPQVTIDEARGE